MNEQIFLESAARRFSDYKKMGEKTFAQLEEKDFHYQPNEAVNSIAINITHLHGNMISRWTNFLTEDGEKTWRDRDDEFEVHDFSKEKLLQLWEEGWQAVFNGVSALTPADLSKTIHIRAEPLNVMDATLRSLAHVAYHIGQIVLLAKLIKNDQWTTITIPKKKR